MENWRLVPGTGTTFPRIALEAKGKAKLKRKEKLHTACICSLRFVDLHVIRLDAPSVLHHQRRFQRLRQQQQHIVVVRPVQQKSGMPWQMDSLVVHA